MSKQIPYLFDSVIISSPLEKVSQDMPNTGRARVRVFSKYGNRNGSYITDQVADQLIESAITKHCPVVGFFDPQSQTWASHTGPTLAHGYGYVEDFLGWEPTEDTDGVIRDYAVFSIVLHTDYFEEANKIIGQNQSMELNPKTIQGEWAVIDEDEYFIYSFAEMLGFCVIGSNEPCFSASTFFSKNEENKTQFEQFSSLLFELRAKVEEAKNFKEGGEQPMEENKVVETPVEETVVEETPAVENFENVEEPVVEETIVEEPTVEEPATEFEEETPAEEEPEVEVEEPTVEETSNTEFEALQNDFNELQSSFEALQNELTSAQERIATFEAEIETLNNTNNNLQEQLTAAQATIANYEKSAAEEETERKDTLIQDYEKVLSAEEITPIKEAVADFSYDELESKLAVIFSRKNLSGESRKVPLPEPEESEFAKLMKKYRK